MNTDKRVDEPVAGEHQSGRRLPKPSSRGSQPRKAQAWGEDILTKVTSMRTLMHFFKASDHPDTPNAPLANERLEEGIAQHLNAASEAAQRISVDNRKSSVSAAMERAESSVDAAEEMLLLRSPQSYLRGQLPRIHSDVRKYLEIADPRRVMVERVAQEKPESLADEGVREGIVVAASAAHRQARMHFARARSFKTAVVATSVVLFLMAALVALLGWWGPSNLALCFYPQELQKVVCATNEVAFDAGDGATGTDIDDAIRTAARPYDVLLIELLGLVAASVSGASSLRKVKGTSTPFSLPIALALVKLPTGALTAFLGLLLMRGQFVPGLSALDSSAQILGWAVIFGASQQLLTGLVDKQAGNVLDKVGGTSHASPAQAAR
jgi:hypothetical protein